MDAKRRQRLRWGTPDWVQAYNMRTHVEGSYGNLKSSTGGNLRRGWCHARGRVRVGLMLACADGDIDFAPPPPDHSPPPG